MKKLKYLILLLTITFIGCGAKDTKNPTEKIEPRFFTVRGFTGAIVEIEFKKHEYLSWYGGALVHSESCPCKNK